MKVNYNALSRLKRALADAGIADLLLSTRHGQMLNTAICDCDYFDWLDNKDSREAFEGDFLTEYSWGEPILATILSRQDR
jgi:two-component system, LytTR family, response regulator